MKTEIFNLIILDESGSMGCVRRQTINGCNETIQSIKASQEKYPDTQEHFVSIYCFQSGAAPSRFLIKNVPGAAAVEITESDYRPSGCTPLFDAVGSTLADLKFTVQNKPNAVGSVTIITDGEENSSREYTFQKVAAMISQLKELGWNFNFIGANIDVKGYARKLNIDNAMEFQQDEEGTKKMFKHAVKCCNAYADRLNDCDEQMLDEACESEEEYNQKLTSLRKKASKNYFDC